ncbi:CBM96 family carbohydrate-binding protein [Pontibacillus marinus]|uniref:Fibronectin n=1 Tax=Pontibacillus marinus BH030004 = DSM 16465 TaxID=1385511 RepID=A0A0A5GBA5_9BACI|nr:DNRLRE domain-containing protein [Pontibacillus marinus]KGX90446.1 fibronectin [Pontibacillus marinus BH030004 = DSM 16465]
MKKWIRLRLMVAFVLLLPLLFFNGVTPNTGYAVSSLTITSHDSGANLPVGTVRISGSYSDVSNIQLIIDGMKVSQAQMVPDSSQTHTGEWYYELDTRPYDGEIEIVARGTNTLTRYTSWSEPVLLSVDNKKANIPAVTILDPETNTTIKKHTKVNINASGKNTIEAVYIRINGNEWVSAQKQNQNNYSHQLKLPMDKDKTYSLEAKAVDSIGNTGYSSTVYVRTGEGRPSSTNFEKQDRAMWIWENASYNLIFNEGSRKVLDAMAKDTTTFNQDPITTLYLGVDEYFGVDMLEDERDRVRDLISWAHDNGYKIHALIAGGTKPPHFGAFERYHDVALKEVENIINYNLSSKQAEQFDGVNIDIEPYIASQFKTEKPSLQLQYLDLLEKTVNLKKVSDSSLLIGAAIPNWYDSSQYAEAITWGPKLEEGAEQTKWLSQHIQDILDYISIMDYRDFAERSNGIIERARGEIEYAETIGKPNSVVIGVETKDIADGGDPELISFREEGRTYMEAELDKVYASMNGYSSFGGIALHHYDTIRYLPSEWSSDGVLWQPPHDTDPPSMVDRQPNASTLSYQSILLDYGRAYDNYEVEHYNIYRGLNAEFTPNESNLAGSSRRLSFVDSGLMADTTYYYKVAAVDVRGNIGPVSSVTSTTTQSSSLNPMIIGDASITYENGKAHVSLQVIDQKTKSPVIANISGRFEYLSGKVVSGTTDENGEITFTSESFGTNKGKIGFKVNTIAANEYYWASASDVLYDLSTTWSLESISASQDAHVRSDSYGDTNYGSDAILKVKGLEETIQNYDRMSFIQFSNNQSSLTDTKSVILKIYVDRDISDPEVPSVPVSVYGAQDTSWDEGTITWNTQPDPQAFTKLGQIDISGAAWYQLDVTEWVSQLENIDTLSFRLSDEALKDRLVPIHSKENDNPALLEIKK